MIYFFLISIFFFFSNEEKVMLCVVFLFYVFFLSMNGDVHGGGMLLDDLSFSMVFLTLILMMIVFMSVESGKKKHFFLSLSMSIVVMYFLVKNIFSFFILFEFSLLPIFFLISFWGIQPERLMAVKFMMVYTLVASSPLLFFFIFLSSKGSNLMYLNENFFDSSSKWGYLVFLSLLAFWVKIPLFFFHSWLPKAHVEASLEGSMILAGVMLKVGMYGMIRVLSFFSYSMLKQVIALFFCIGLIGSLVSVMVAISSDDMKMSVAFSSISHMNFCVASLASMKISSIESWIMVMISHGLSSPMMFFLVTKIYKCSGSRKMLISKGLVSKFPFFQFISFIIWGMNVSVPPSLSFLGEVSMIFSIYSTYSWSMMVVLFYFVFSSFFSMFNYGIQSHSSVGMPWKKSISLMAFSISVIFSGFFFFFFFFFFVFICS
uniref:NADH-ubiquinone oxidoreductase chain 4 n=1 Tax=Campanulotes compar TaxID=135595 RepID=Q2HJK7_9NEOP|nr:NADH dehydrogenase subunit 4 [Campanulotes compar]